MSGPFPAARLQPVSVRAEARTATFHLPADHPCFAGHFPGRPILPAVAHVALAVATRAALGGPLELHGLRDLRFTTAANPEDVVDVTLLPSGTSNGERFEVRRAGTLLSCGTLLLAPHVQMPSP